MKIILTFIILTACFSINCFAQKKYYPLKDIIITNDDSIIICLTDIENLHFKIVTLNDTITSSEYVTDSSNVEIVIDKNLIVNNANNLYVLKNYKDCYYKTPYYQVLIFVNGNELKSFEYCYPEQMFWGKIKKQSKKAKLKYLVCYSESIFSLKLEELKNMNNVILLSSIINENQFVIRFFEIPITN